jgi:hypothetical protein
MNTTMPCADPPALDEATRAARHAIAQVAAAIIAQDLPLLVGCRDLVQLHWNARLAQGDADFGLLIGVVSETDALPLGAERRHWSGAALARIEPQIQAATQWARPTVLPICERLVCRFAQAPEWA